MNTPQNLADLKHFANVFPVDTAGVGIEFESKRVFNEEFGEDYRPDLEVSVRYLFTDTNEEGDQVKVYEAYKDSGSEDYIYLTATL